MINKSSPWHHRVFLLVIFILAGALIATPLLNAGVHFLVGSTTLLLAGVFLAMRISVRKGYMYLFMLSGFIASYVMPQLINDINLSSKGNAEIKHLRELTKTGAAIFNFSDVYVEKERYGHYLHSYRGHTGYFVAPVVPTGWTPFDTVYLFAGFSADSPYDSLIFTDSDVAEGISANDSVSSVSIDLNPSRKNGIYYFEWNQNYNRGLRINDDVGRYEDAVTDAARNHQLKVAKNPILIYWTDAPEEILQRDKSTNMILTALLFIVIIIWAVSLEIKMARAHQNHR